MAQRVGEQLGNYQLIKLVGEDGFAENYLGEHYKSRALAVIKVLNTQLADGEAERFLSEASPLVNLVHPHILRVLEFGVEKGTPFLVVEYAPHGNLRQRHSKGTRLPLSTIIDYARQAADGLKYAHERNLVHRDVKPENMQLGRHDEVLLSDFSTDLVARMSSNEGSQEVAGTILYMAPEQIEGKPVPASDQYALGIVVYEWLSGNCPFAGSFNEIAIQHLMKPPPSLREAFPTISSELEQVVMTALAKDPRERFGTVGALANALSQVRQANMTQPFVPSYTTKPLLSSSTPVLAITSSSSRSSVQAASTALMTPTDGLSVSPVSTPVTPVTVYSTGVPVTLDASPVSEPATERGRVVSRRTVLAGVVGIGVVAIAGGVAWQTHLLGLGSSATVVSTHTVSNNIAPGSKVLRIPVFIYRGHNNQVQAVAWSHNGTRIASGSFDTTVQIWDAATGNPLRTYSGHGAQVRSVKWSRDDTRIASSDDNWQVHVWEAATGKLITKYTRHTGYVSQVDWSPDSKKIVSASGDMTVQIWDANIGKHILTYTGHPDIVRAVAWSHHSDRIVSGCDNTEVHVWDATTAKHLLSYSGHNGQLSGLAWSLDDARIASGSWDTTVQVWESSTAKPIFTYSYHKAEVWTLAWSPDGAYIVSGGRDRTAQVWDAATGKPITTYIGHTADVDGLSWAPGSNMIVSGSKDKTAQVWKAL